MIPKDCIIEYDNDYYVVCKRICTYIGLSKGQYHNEFKKLKKDPLFL